MKDTRTVYRTVGRVVETCAYGCEHEVAYVEVKHLTATGQTRVHDNGYEQRETPLYVDAQGRTYHQHVSIDYFNNITFVRDDDPNWRPFTPRPEGTLARDLAGKPVTAATPAGPAWGPHLPGAWLAGQPRPKKRRR